jgi:hypothetical protein
MALERGLRKGDKMEDTINKLQDLRKECAKRMEEATNAICWLEGQRERLAEMSHAIDELSMEIFKKGKK